MNIEFEFKTTQRARRLSLRLSPDGKPLVIAPYGTPRALATKLVAENQSWIDAQTTRRNRLIPLITNDFVLIFGIKYTRIIKNISNLPPGYYIDDTFLIFNPIDINQPSKFQATQLKRFLKSAAAQFIEEKTFELANKTNLQPKSVGLREQTSRWGSCSGSKHLSFNWRLAHFHPQVIEYVIIHELAHLKHPNHSRRFWQTVIEYCPDYKKHKQTLKKYLLSDE